MSRLEERFPKASLVGGDAGFDALVAEVVAVAILIEIKATTRIIILVVEGVIILTVVVARKGIITIIHKETMIKHKGKTK